MDTPQLIQKLNSYGISLCVKNEGLVCDSETPIPRGIALTIAAQEKRLISYLEGNKADNSQTNEPKNHNLIPNDTADLRNDLSPHLGEVNQSKVTADSEPTPLLNKGIPEKTADKVHYRLPPILLHNLMLWVARYHELRLEHPNGVILNAQPKHVIEASEAYPWGVIYDPERYLLLSWGSVPESALREKRDLETGELLIAEQVAA